MEFSDLYRSVFGILQIENTTAKIVGTGFIVKTNPITILTCNHVVGEGTQQNNGAIRYAITKRTDNFEEFDIRNAQISYISVSRISYRPESDLALLEVDPTQNVQVATLLRIADAPSLPLSFEAAQREFGSSVEWLSTAATGDLTLTPRFFKGNLISRYLTNQSYKYKNAHGQEVTQMMTDVRMLEIDKLFIPGSSGSPIINSETNNVIGFVHGFRSWPILTGNDITHDIELTENNVARDAKVKYKLPLTTSLSLGIDLRTIEDYLRTENVIQ